MMEDIEYLEEYEDFILPKTLNYSEEYPENGNEKELEKTCNDLNLSSTFDIKEPENCVELPVIQKPRPKKANLIKIINTEVLSTTAQIQGIKKDFLSSSNFIPLSQELKQRDYDKQKNLATVTQNVQNSQSSLLFSISSSKTNVNIPEVNKDIDNESFLNYAVEKNTDVDFNAEFNLDTAEISDIYSDSINFSDDYTDDMSYLESLLSSEENGKHSLKRKSLNHSEIKIEHKKSRVAQNNGKHTISSTNQKESEAKQKGFDKRRNRISMEKKKHTSNGQKSKLVVKKNGKKFVFPDRSKFSLKNLNNSNNVEDNIQTRLAIDSVSVNAKTETNKVNETDEEIVNHACILEKRIPLEIQNNDSSSKNETTKDQPEISIKQDIVIFSSPTNMKRISQTFDAEPLGDNNTTPCKSTGLSFAHFSLKSIKPPNRLKLKQTSPSNPENPSSKELEKTADRTTLAQKKCLDLDEKADKNVQDVSGKSPIEETFNKEKYQTSSDQEKSILLNVRPHETTSECVADKIIENNNTTEMRNAESRTVLDNIDKNDQTDTLKIRNISENCQSSSLNKSNLKNSIPKTIVTTSKEKFIKFDTDRDKETQNECMSKQNFNASLNSKSDVNEMELSQKKINNGDSPLNKNISSSKEIDEKLRICTIPSNSGDKTIAIDGLNGEKLNDSLKENLPTVKCLPHISSNEKMVSNKKQNQNLSAHNFEMRNFSIRVRKNIVTRILNSIKKSKESEVQQNVDDQKSTSTIVYPIIKSSLCEPSMAPESPATNKKSKKERSKKKDKPINAEQSCEESLPLESVFTDNTLSAGKINSNFLGNINLQTFTDKIILDKTTTFPSSLIKNGNGRNHLNIKIPSEDSTNKVDVFPIIQAEAQGNIKKNTLKLSPNKNAEQKTTNLKAIEPIKVFSKAALIASVTENVENRKISPIKESSTKLSPAKAEKRKPEKSSNCENRSTKNTNNIEILEPKKETEEVEHFRPENFISNDIVNKIKSNESRTNLSNCKNLFHNFTNEENISKTTVFELPAYIVMKTKIITRKDLEISKTVQPPVIKQQLELETDSIVTEPVIKTERPEFNSVCAQINALLEQNANYLKFASASERQTRMQGVLGDYSLTEEDAKCTLKFLKSYLSSAPRDKSIRTRGQKFIPIYDSQKKIIGYRKRTIYSKPPSRENYCRRSKTSSRASNSIRTVNQKLTIQTVESFENATKIETEVMDLGESELILPDLAPANDICIKSEEDFLG